MQSEDGCCRDFRNHFHPSNLLDELTRQRKTGEFLDVVIEVEGRKFPCHRAVLASTPYFKAMLSSSYIESNSKVVQMHGIDATAFSKILNFVYTGKISISKRDVQDILQAAHMLQIDTVLRYCEDFIGSNLRPSNYLGVMRLAELYGFSALNEKARRKAVFYFSEVTQNEEFLTLTAQELVDLLREEELGVTNEDEIAYSVIRWLDHAPESRKTAAVFAILQVIHLSHVRVSALQKLKSHALVQASAESLAKITAAEEKHRSGAWQLSADTEQDQSESRHRPWLSDDMAIIVGGWKTSELDVDKEYEYSIDPLPFPEIVCVDHGTDGHYHVTSLPTTVSGYMSAASAGHYLYITGGRAHPTVGHGPHSAPSRQAFRYDFSLDIWTRLPDMPRGRAAHQSIVVDGKLFLVGGDTETTSEMRMDCYDLGKGVWTEPPTLPKTVTSEPSSLTVTACEGRVVLIETSRHPENSYYARRKDMVFTKERIHSVYLLDVNTFCWTYLHLDITMPRSFAQVDILATAADGAKLYFLVAEKLSSTIYVYDCREETLTPAKEREKGFTKNILCAGSAFGLYDGHLDTIDTTYRYDEHGSVVQMGLPFDLCGHSFLGTKKSSIGWYCRDLEELPFDEKRLDTP